jgi:hypothetical protein
MLVRNYHVSIDEPQVPGETFEQRCDRILKTHESLTLTPDKIPIAFTRR